MAYGHKDSCPHPSYPCNCEENSYKERFENADNHAKEKSHQCGVLWAELEALSKQVLDDRLSREHLKSYALILRNVWKFD